MLQELHTNLYSASGNVRFTAWDVCFAPWNVHPTPWNIKQIPYSDNFPIAFVTFLRPLSYYFFYSYPFHVWKNNNSIRLIKLPRGLGGKCFDCQPLFLFLEHKAKYYSPGKLAIVTLVSMCSFPRRNLSTKASTSGYWHISLSNTKGRLCLASWLGEMMIRL